MRQKSNTPETPSERLVRDIRRATRKQYSVEEDSIAEVARQMTVRRLRHLPVKDGTRIVGIVSLGDVLKGLDETQFEGHVLYSRGKSLTRRRCGRHEKLFFSARDV